MPSQITGLLGFSSLLAFLAYFAEAFSLGGFGGYSPIIRNSFFLI